MKQQLFFGNERLIYCINLKNLGYKIINVHNALYGTKKKEFSQKKRISAVIKKVKMEIEVNLNF